MTIVTLIWVMYPVLRPGKAKMTEREELHAYDSAVYCDQLLELERDADRGLIDQKEKQSALNEVSRRLLAAQENHQQAPALTISKTRTGQIITVVSVLVIIGISGLLYLKIGRPDLPDMPQEQRIANASKTGDMPALILQVERFLEKNPKDIRGWNVLAPALRRAGRYEEAAQAYSQIMRIDRPTAPILVDYAESLLMANKGEATDKVRQALKTAMDMDGKASKARFYWAMMLQQDGKPDEALAEWRKLIELNPKNIPLQMAIQKQIAALKKGADMPGKPDGAKMPSLDKSQREAAASMTPKERQAMIASMVQRLADRLKENGKDLDGWLKLIRARMVLGQKDAAAASVKTARENFKDDKAALERLNQLSGSLGLNK